MSHFTYKYQVCTPYGYGWEQKSFKTQKELFEYLVTNKDLIIDQKKSVIKLAEGGLSLCFNPEFTKAEDFENKAIKVVHENNKEEGILKRTIVANTYYYMDSHSDVHIGKGEMGEEGTSLFTEVIKAKGNKIAPMDQHNYSLDGRIGKTTRIYEAPISWRALGLGRTGMTEALFAEAEIYKAKNEARYNDYLNDEIDQHSVGMRYIDVQLAINDPEQTKEYAVYQKHIARIGNRQAVDKQGFFFAINKADLREYSPVIAGSNDLTPTLAGSGEPTKQEPSGEGNVDKEMEAIEKLYFKLLN